MSKVQGSWTPPPCCKKTAIHIPCASSRNLSTISTWYLAPWLLCVETGHLFHAPLVYCVAFTASHIFQSALWANQEKRGVSSTPAGNHLQQECSDKPIVLKLPSAEQQAAKAIEWQINTVKHRAEEIYFPRALLGIKEGLQDSNIWL